MTTEGNSNPLSVLEQVSQQRIAPPGVAGSDLAAEMLATVLGVEFNPDSSWDEKREIWKIADVIADTREVTASAVGHKGGHWTTVVASAILLP